MSNTLPIAFSKNIENLFGFFDQYALDNESGIYFSEIDNQGKRVSNKIYLVALSRHIYGLAYTSQFYPLHLAKAQKMANYLLNNLVGTDSDGPYFKSCIENGVTDTSIELDVWQQAYGLCGISELYRITMDAELLIKIHQLHQSFIARFRDTETGGFWGNYVIGKGPVKGSKTLQSLMYPITAYMANLWLADTANRKKYEPVLADNLSIISAVGWNNWLNWVNIKFDDTWRPCLNNDAQKPCFKVMPGHNFQVAALMMRASKWEFLDEPLREKYNFRGHIILNATLEKPIFGSIDLSQGFCSEVNPINDVITDDRKTWWQHCEALIALSLGGEKFDDDLLKLEQFYFANFPDYNLGGEYFYIDNINSPITSENKGNMGKATYHTIEMIRFLFENN